MNKTDWVSEALRYMDGGTAPKLSRARVAFVLDAMLAEVVRAVMVPGEKTSYWPGVGKFSVTWDKARVYSDIKTRQCIAIPARYRLHYRESLRLRRALA